MLPALLPWSTPDSPTATFDVHDLTAVLLIGSAVMLLAIAAVRITSRSSLPTLLVYLGIGLALGESGLGIRFSDPAMGQVLGYSALILILAEGGLTTRWAPMRPAVPTAVMLSTVGVVVSIGVTGLGAHLLLGWPWPVALLVGAVVSSTDAAAVFSILRTVPMPRRLSAMLEAESGFNDAPVVIVVVALAERLTSGDDGPLWWLPLTALVQLVAGALIGCALGVVGGWFLRRIAGSSSTLFAIGVLSVTVSSYAIAASLDASGFIATYACGVVLGNLKLPHSGAVGGFATAIGWVAQIGLFVMLGLLASPSRLHAQIGPALAIGLVLLLVARPLSVVVSCTPFRMRWRDQLFLSWAGLRGAVPIVLATVPVTLGAAGLEWIFDLVLVLVVIFTLVQAPLLPWIARRLGLACPPLTRSVALESMPLETLGAEVIQVQIGPESRLHGVAVFELRLPRRSRLALLVRDGDTSVPQAGTRLRHGDELLIVTTASERDATERRLYALSADGRLAGWHTRGGPSAPRRVILPSRDRLPGTHAQRTGREYASDAGAAGEPGGSDEDDRDGEAERGRARE